MAAGERVWAAAHIGEVVPQKSIAFFSGFIIHPTGRHGRRRMARNGSKRVFWYKDVPFGGFVDS
jgi:hypothetical protein